MSLPILTPPQISTSPLPKNITEPTSKTKFQFQEGRKTDSFELVTVPSENKKYIQQVTKERDSTGKVINKTVTLPKNLEEFQEAIEKKLTNAVETKDKHVKIAYTSRQAKDNKEQLSLMLTSNGDSSLNGLALLKSNGKTVTPILETTAKINTNTKNLAHQLVLHFTSPKAERDTSYSLFHLYYNVLSEIKNVSSLKMALKPSSFSISQMGDKTKSLIESTNFKLLLNKLKLLNIINKIS